MEERKTTYGEVPVDLIPFILKYQERFVLKPNDDYGGRGIVLGWQTNTSGWEQAVEEALKTPYVVQERVPIPEEPYPAWLTAVCRYSTACWTRRPSSSTVTTWTAA